MKTLFLIKKVETPSSRIRVINLIPRLQEQGIDAEYKVIPKKILSRFKLYSQCKSYDIVVLQKKMLNIFEIKLLRKFCKKLIYDFDDAIYLKAGSCSTDHSKHISNTRTKKFNTIIKNVDAVIAANDVLNNKVLSLAPEKPTYIIPSAVETKDISIKADYSRNAKVSIGWVGTEKTQRYLHYIAPALQKLSEEIPFTLKVISSVAPVIEGIDITFCKWGVKKQYDDLCSCDIAIMPLSPDQFSEGKSAYKLLQYMSSAVPSVCSEVGMNATISDSESYCLSATSLDDFSKKSRQLLSDEKLREELGKKGRELILTKYSIEKVSSRLADTLRDVFQKNQFQHDNG